MKLLGQVTSGLKTFAGIASTLTVAASTAQGRGIWNSSNPVAMQQVMANFSSTFGNILAGSAVNTDELDATCANINATSNGKWQAEGLDTYEILGSVCLTADSFPIANESLPYVVGNNTNVFVTQIVNAFGGENQELAMSHVCDNLEPAILDSFLDGYSAQQAICAIANWAYNATDPTLHADAVTIESYKEAASIMFGKVFVSSAASDSQVNIYCAHAGKYIDALNVLGLNGTVVEQTICDSTWPLTVQQGVDAIINGTTTMFLIALEQLSTNERWVEWLCENLDIPAMYGVGLNGTWVADQVC